MRRALALLAFCTALAIIARSQVFTTLTDFDGRHNGDAPQAPLIQGNDGNFYGTTSFGGYGTTLVGNSEAGTVFKVTPDGKLTTLHVFGTSDIGVPTAPLFLASDGTFYGTTWGEGIHGSVFNITSEGSYKNLYASDGFTPYGGLVQASDGNFYGTSDSSISGYGTVFRITPEGVLTTLHTFWGPDGAAPLAGLLLANDGFLYGTTLYGGYNYGGGRYGYGTVFKITIDGTLTTLHSFDCSTDGCFPIAPLIQASDGNLYGTTSEGGAGDGGTVFRITPQGTLTTLYRFPASQATWPNGLVQARDGSLYGTTYSGGFKDCGTIFRITLEGKLTILHVLRYSDGANPEAGMMLSDDGDLYGTTAGGGTRNLGTIFHLALYSLLSVAMPEAGGGTVRSTDQHIYCGQQCSYSYLNRTQVTLSAVPSAGYTFTGWTGCNNVNGSYCSVTLAGPKNVIATFTRSDVGLTSLALNPSSVKGGNISIATISLNAPAPEGGLGVAITTDQPLVVHPPSLVTVPGGVSSFSFAVRTSVVRMTTVANVTATADASQVNATLTVTTGYGSSQAPSSEPQR